MGSRGAGWVGERGTRWISSQRLDLACPLTSAGASWPDLELMKGVDVNKLSRQADPCVWMKAVGRGGVDDPEGRGNSACCACFVKLRSGVCE